MKFRIDFTLNDGKSEAPPYEVEVDTLDDHALSEAIVEEFMSDHGAVYGPGAKLVIERLV